ncbi:MAG: polynucleotide kinase [Alphaproteobacteria bacterium]|nr:polynucleotide kinase [Alphaproteobacteria bacterium]
MTKKTIIFDIDGTLAEITHRRKFLEQEKKDWKSFNDKMGDDTPNDPVVELYKTLWETGKYEIIIISGRTEKYRELTEQWFIWNDIPFETLHMRPNGDYRADHIIKEELLERFKSEGKDILFVVDDRQQVVDMWRRNGITCLQCAEGDF